MPYKVYRRGLRAMNTWRSAGLTVPICGLAFLVPRVHAIGWGAWLAWLALPIVLAPQAAKLLPRLNWGRWKRAILVEGHCPSCGYALEGLSEEGDGCRVCAECGAGWRLPA
jgi:hypothetical protein